MPNMIMSRDFVVNTMWGHRIVFAKDKPVFVPELVPVIEECQRYGAVYAEGEDPVFEPELTIPQAPSGDERTQKIRDAMQQMVLRNERNDFGANGAPNLKPLNEVLGFTVDRKERDTIWEQVQAENAKATASN